MKENVMKDFVDFRIITQNLQANWNQLKHVARLTTKLVVSAVDLRILFFNIQGYFLYITIQKRC